MSTHPKILLISILISQVSFAQEHSIKEAQKYFKTAERTKNILEAARLYEMAAKLNPTDAKTQFKAGYSLTVINDEERSLPYFIKGHKLDPKVFEHSLLYIGLGYQCAEKFDSDIYYYSAYKNVLLKGKNDNRSKYLLTTENSIIECQNAKVYKSRPVNVTIKNISEVNSQFSDYGPTLSEDGLTMVFTSRRPILGNRNDLDEDGDYFENIFITRKINDRWEQPKVLKNLISTQSHRSCINLSPDGKTLLIYSDENGGDIFFSTAESIGFSKMKPIKGEVNTEWRENSASLTRDGNRLYFSSDKPGGIGGSDIYVATRSKDGIWEKPVNLGSKINTIMDEEGIFVSPDGLNLFFSSNGWAGMGGYDIYRATYDPVKGEWNTPINLGYPINGPKNEIYFVLTNNGKTAYYSTIKQRNYGNMDIYQIDMSNWKEVQIKSRPKGNLVTHW